MTFHILRASSENNFEISFHQNFFPKCGTSRDSCKSFYHKGTDKEAEGRLCGVVANVQHRCKRVRTPITLLRPLSKGMNPLSTRL